MKNRLTKIQHFWGKQISQQFCFIFAFRSLGKKTKLFLFLAKTIFGPPPPPINVVHLLIIIGWGPSAAARITRGTKRCSQDRLGGRRCGHMINFTKCTKFIGGGVQKSFSRKLSFTTHSCVDVNKDIMQKYHLLSMTLKSLITRKPKNTKAFTKVNVFLGIFTYKFESFTFW